MSRHRILATATLLGAVLWAGSPARAQQTAEWTVMMYLNGDSAAGLPNLANAAITHINCLEQVGSTASVNLIVQWSRGIGGDNLKTYYAGDSTQNWSGARRYYIVQDPNQVGTDPYAIEPGAGGPAAGYRLYSPLQLDLGSVDMGSEDSLVDYCQWTFQKFPARHYLLIVDDGGLGWQPRSVRGRPRGVLFDGTTGNYLSNTGLRSALTRVRTLLGKNLDALIFDASGQGCLETVYQCRDTADYVLGTWLQRPVSGYPYHTWMSGLTKSPPTSTDTLEAWLKQCAADYNSNYQTGTTAPSGAQSTAVSVFRMNQIEGVKKAADNLATALMTDLPSFAPGVMRALAQVQYGNANDFSGSYLDLQHFGSLLQTEVTNSGVVAAGGAIPAAVSAALVNSSIFSNVTGSLDLSHFNGVALYFPRIVDNLDTNYSLSGDFVSNTEWDELVQGLLTLNTDTTGPTITINSPLSGATIIENPPTILATIVDTGTGGKVNTSSLQVAVDGVQVDTSAFSYDSSSGLLTYVIPSPLAVTAHTFTITAKDLSGNTTTATGNFRIAVPTIPAGVQTFSLPRMVTSATSDPALVFGASNFSLVRWAPTLFGTSKYRVYPDLLATFMPSDSGSGLNSPTVSSPPAGLGYWVRVINARPLVSLPGTAISASEYRIRLYKNPDGGAGWNMVANPYDVAAVGLASMQVLRSDGQRITFQQAIDQSITPGVLFTYVQNSANPNAAGRYDFEDAGVGSMQRLQGHWLKVNADCTLVVTSGSRSVTAPPPAAARRSVPAGGWQLALRADAGQAGNDQVLLGASRATSDAYDSGWDVESPPTLPGAVEVRAVHTDWAGANGRYMRDFRGVGGRVQWNVDVTAPEGEVVLSWPSLRSLPENVDLVLTDLSSGQQRRLRNSSSYRFQHGGGVRSFTVSGGPEVGGAVGLDSMSVLASRGGGYTVAYTLTRSADVVLVLRSLSGRVLRTLPASASSAGRSQVYWDGRAADGSPLPNGIYQLEIVATAGDGATARQVRIVRLAH